MVLLINSNRVDGSSLTIIPLSPLFFLRERLLRQMWLALPMPLLAEKMHALARPLGQSRPSRWSGGNPPCKVITLVLYIWITLICWLVLAFTVICQFFHNACFRWPPALVGSLAGIPHHFLIFWPWTNQVLCCFFLAGRLVGTSFCWFFAWLSIISQRLCF